MAKMLSVGPAEHLSRAAPRSKVIEVAEPTPWSATALSRACRGTESQYQRRHGSVRRPHTSRRPYSHLARSWNEQRRRAVPPRGADRPTEEAARHRELAVAGRRMAVVALAQRRPSRGTPLQFRSKRMTVSTLSSPDQLGRAPSTVTCRSRSRLRRDAPLLANVCYRKQRAWRRSTPYRNLPKIGRPAPGAVVSSNPGQPH
jgi:hypothetical protein